MPACLLARAEPEGSMPACLSATTEPEGSKPACLSVKTESVSSPHVGQATSSEPEASVSSRKCNQCSSQILQCVHRQGMHIAAGPAECSEAPQSSLQQPSCKATHSHSTAPPHCSGHCQAGAGSSQGQAGVSLGSDRVPQVQAESMQVPAAAVKRRCMPNWATSARSQTAPASHDQAHCAHFEAECTTAADCCSAPDRYTVGASQDAQHRDAFCMELTDSQMPGCSGSVGNTLQESWLPSVQWDSQQVDNLKPLLLPVNNSASSQQQATPIPLVVQPVSQPGCSHGLLSIASQICMNRNRLCQPF